MYPNSIKLSFFIFLVFFLCSSHSFSKEYKGKVVGISDGDTITILTAEKKQIKVRLAEIDTPESAQPYGSRAKQQLSDLIFNKVATIIQNDIDRYGRVVGEVYVEGTYINARMVELGAAWVYRQYAKNQKLYLLEDRARQKKIGLWNLPEADKIPPWDWRRMKKNASIDNSKTSSKDIPKNSENKFSCNTAKSTCSQMKSCKEAYFYLNQCGIYKLDGDGDGIPCNTICR